MTAGNLPIVKQPQSLSATITKAVEPEESPVERMKHPLEHRWSMWLYRAVTNNWEQDCVNLTTFDTVEDYWCLYHHIKLPSELGEGQYSVFKEGMQPAWEDAANRRGGRWLITLEKRHMPKMDSIWTDMVLMMIGENFGDANSSVCGAVVNAKAKNYKSKLAIWMSDKKNEKAILEVGTRLKKALGLPFKITFHAHNHTSILYTV